MLKQKILLIMLILMSLVTIAGAKPFDVTELTIKNKTPYEIYVKLTPVDPQAAGYSTTLQPWVDEVPISVLAIPSGKYWVRASARTRTLEPVLDEVGQPDGSYEWVYGDYFTCFGQADDTLWDEKQAARQMDFQKGKRNLPFTADSCVMLTDNTYTFWKTLPFKTVEYIKSLFSYVY